MKRAALPLSSVQTKRPIKSGDWFQHARRMVVTGTLLLGGCAALQPAEVLPPVVHTITHTIEIPRPVPCFAEADKPQFPAPTPIDIVGATMDQKAAALAADAVALDKYARDVDALFLKCMQTTGAKL